MSSLGSLESFFNFLQALTGFTLTPMALFVKVAQSCLTLQLHGSIYGILQARILEWAAIRSPEDLPNPGIKPRSPALQVDSLPSELPEKGNSWLAGETLLFLARGIVVSLRPYSIAVSTVLTSLLSLSLTLVHFV